MSGSDLRATIASASSDRIELTYEDETGPARVYFQSRDVRLQPNLEACISSGLLPCMAAGRDLVAEGPVSARLVGSLDRIQTIFHQWYPTLKKVAVLGASPVVHPSNEGGRVAVLFSAGVDSFYTLLHRLDEEPDLVFIRGFEYQVEDVELANRTAAAIHRVAAELGLRVIEVETNLRPYLLGQGLRWGLHGGGATKITLGQMLRPEYKRVYISAGCTYAELFPWGSHLMLDPLWNTEDLEFVFFGLEANRIEKLQFLSQFDWVLQNLHVCNERPATALNCGRCEKCIRSMLSLLAIGALDRCPTFERGLEARRIAGLRLHNEGMRAYARQNLQELERGGHPRALIQALRVALRRAQREQALRGLMQSTVPALYTGLQRLRGAVRAGRANNAAKSV